MRETIGPLLAAGNVAEIFELGSRVVKLYKSPGAKPAAFREGAIHAAVEASGLPVPQVWGVHQFGGRWGLVFERVEQKSFAQQMLENRHDAVRYLRCMVRLQTQIHAQPAVRLAALKPRVAANIVAAEPLDARRKESLLTLLAKMPEGDRLCHGDFHLKNILGDPAQPSIIDWPDASRGDPAADVCRSHVLMALHAAEFATAYLDTYCGLSGMDRAAVRAWQPFVAAARLAEAIPGELERLLRMVDPEPH
jgi:aminoglycoside phosphotransferase (APT) family kinase protein